MKNLIAISASALTAASASAAVTAYNNQTTWTTAFTAQYTSPSASVYTDTLHNASMSGLNVVGGHGWGSWTAASVLTTSTLSLTGVGSNVSIVATPNPLTNENFVTFSWANSEGSLGGIYAMGIIFSVTSNATSLSGAPFVSATFQGGGNSNSVTNTGSPSLGPINTPQFIGFIANNSEGIVTLSLGFSAGTIITVNDLVYGIVPAPGAMALLGVAGLVGSRRRRA